MRDATLIIKAINLPNTPQDILKKINKDPEILTDLVKVIGNFGLKHVSKDYSSDENSFLLNEILKSEEFIEEVVKQTKKLLNESPTLPKYWPDVLTHAASKFKDLATLKWIQEYLICIETADLNASSSLNKDFNREIVYREMIDAFDEDMGKLPNASNHSSDYRKRCNIATLAANAIANFLYDESASLPSYLFEALPKASLAYLNTWIKGHLTQPSLVKHIPHIKGLEIDHLKKIYPYVHRHLTLRVQEKCVEEEVKNYQDAFNKVVEAIRSTESNEKVSNYKMQELKSRALLEKVLTDFFGAYARIYVKSTENNLPSEPNQFTAEMGQDFAENAILKLQGNHTIYGRLQALFNANPKYNSSNTTSIWSGGSPLSQFIEKEIKIALSHIDDTALKQVKESSTEEFSTEEFSTEESSTEESSTEESSTEESSTEESSTEESSTEESSTEESPIKESSTEESSEEHIEEELPTHAPTLQSIPAGSDTSRTVFQVVQQTFSTLGTFSVKICLAPFKAILACWKAFCQLLRKIFSTVTPKQDIQKTSETLKVSDSLIESTLPATTEGTLNELGIAKSIIKLAESKFHKYAVSEISALPIPINTNIKISEKFLSDANKELIHSISIEGKKYDFPKEDSGFLGYFEYDKLGHSEYIVPCKLYDFCTYNGGFSEDEFLYISDLLSEFPRFIECYLPRESRGSSDDINQLVKPIKERQRQRICSFSIERLANHAVKLAIYFQRDVDSSFIECPMILAIDVRSSNKKVTILDEKPILLEERLAFFYSHWFEQPSPIADDKSSDIHRKALKSVEKSGEFHSMNHLASAISRTA